MKINILGDEYDYSECTAKEDSRLSDYDGYHDGYAKIIRVESDYNENHPRGIQNWSELKKSVKRHEIIHAFFHASGLQGYSDNEQLVNWIALQFPKLLTTFKEIDAL